MADALSFLPDIDLIRTRDPAKLDESDIVLDVGGVYDPSKHRYDHHQRGFEEVFSPNHKTKLSSAGLVYKHFGKQVIAQALQEKREKDDAKVEILYKKLYENFVEALDGIDNGIQQYEGDSKPRYSSRTDLSSRVGHVRASDASYEPGSRYALLRSSTHPGTRSRTMLSSMYEELSSHFHTTG